MKRIFAALAIAATASLASLQAVAQERVGDAALGALSGAVVFGPVGAMAGAVVGFTAGPSIAGAWGLRGHRPHHYARHPRRPPHGARRTDAAAKPAQTARASTLRPVQALE
jgi:hypothetical protein